MIYFSLFLAGWSLLILWKFNEIKETAQIIASTFQRDVQLFTAVFLKLIPTWIWLKKNNETVYKTFDKLAARCPEKVCLIFEDTQWTRGEVQRMSFQVSNYFQKKGLRKGDVVAVGMTNRPEMICIWLGLSRIGVITAFINYNLKGNSLQHCLTCNDKCKAVIIGPEMREPLKEIWTDKNFYPIYELDTYHNVSMTTVSSRMEKDPILNTIDLAHCLKTTSDKPTMTTADESPTFNDTLFYIFTSGTTGLPKQAKITHARICISVAGAWSVLNVKPEDKIYCPLPMYHLFANYGVCWTLSFGCALVIPKTFSASRFWNDVDAHKVTIFLYMGEVCRYLLRQPQLDPQAQVKNGHSIRIMMGAGLKPKIWQEFQERFNVQRIVETYGSTEGNCSLINIEGRKVGAMGYVPIWLQKFYSVQIAKVDPVTGEICRDKKTGFAMKCNVNEDGELVGRMSNLFPLGKFDGFTSGSETEKKIAKNLFRTGDRYFRSGDLVCRDSHGYVYFRDRMGDTFRWKGENVSTEEVEAVVLKLTGLRKNVVYGVEIPGNEGRAGMLAILDEDGTLDVKELNLGLIKELPKYARPMFIRCVRDPNGIPMTGTYKIQKFQLAKEAFNPEIVGDTIYVYSLDSQSYRILDTELYQQIVNGIFRL